MATRRNAPGLAKQLEQRGRWGSCGAACQEEELVTAGRWGRWRWWRAAVWGLENGDRETAGLWELGGRLGARTNRTGSRAGAPCTRAASSRWVGFSFPLSAFGSLGLNRIWTPGSIYIYIYIFNTHGGAPPALRRGEITVPPCECSKIQCCVCF